MYTYNENGELLENGMWIDYYDVADILNNLESKLSITEAKLAECEKSKESYRLQNEQHHLQLLQFYSRLGVEAFGADIHEKALETLMIIKEQLAESKNKCRECKHLNKKIELNIKNKLMAENCELQKQLAEKEKEKEY